MAKYRRDKEDSSVQDKTAHIMTLYELGLSTVEGDFSKIQSKQFDDFHQI